MATEWTRILRKLGVKHPQTRSEMLISLLWDDICKPIWKTRYNIKHNTKKFSSLDKMSSLADKLMWYYRHQDKVLDYCHRFLIDCTLSDIERWTRITRTSKVVILDNAMRFHKIECVQSARHQSMIYNWMSRHKKIRSGHLIGEGLINTWDVGNRPPPTIPTPAHLHSVSSEENEFQWDQPR